jgi:hypothetical protein
LPAGFSVVHAEIRDSKSYLNADLILDGPAGSPASKGTSDPLTVQIDVWPRAYPEWHYWTKLPPAQLTIAGHPAWYQQGILTGQTFDPAEGRLMIETDTCGILVHSDDFRRVTPADLEKMMNAATYRSCSGTADWIPMAG